MVIELFRGETMLACLSQPVSWEISYGPGSPTDAWNVTAVAQEQTLALLKTANRIVFRDDGQIRLRGIVDEITVSLSPKGRLVTLNGRGMGGLLMDNEALPAVYLQTGLRDLLDAYVTPYGLDLEKSVEIPNLWNYTVAAGDSCYGVLAGYTRWAAGITPRFSAEGGLLLLPEGSGSNLTIDSSLPILEAECCERRYGVISQIVQLDTKTGKKTVFENETYRGGESRRVVTSSGTGYRASGMSPEERIRDSMKQKNTLILTVAGLFLARPDDIAQVRLPALGIEGEYLVTQATNSVSAQGLQCGLELRAWK